MSPFGIPPKNKQIIDGQKDKKFFRKDYHYIEEHNSFYKFHVVPKNWADAKRVCDLEAAILFHPENENEAKTVITSLWEKNQPHVKWVWVGLSDTLVEGVFETVDGKSVDEVYTKWFAQGQPDDSGGNEDCVTLDLIRETNDYVCDLKSSFLCKKSLQSLEWNNQCNMPNVDYIFSKDTSKCYKLHTTPSTWNEAYEICQLEQSYLAVINSQQEADFLAMFTASTPKPRLKGKYSREKYHVGFHHKLNEGWETIKRTPMNADLWFENYQPVGSDNGQCGSMLFDGRLIDTDCDTKSFFICENA